MLQYLVILLDDTSVAYCHAENPLTERNLMPIETLKKAIFWAMKENLMIQFVYPDYELPEEYKEVINTIDHFDAVSSLCEDETLQEDAEIIVFNEWTGVQYAEIKPNAIYVIRTSIEDLLDRYKMLPRVLYDAKRVTIVLTDVENFSDPEMDKYNEVLSFLNTSLVALYRGKKQPQLNILTDRLTLNEMHNCGAGDSNITVAPNGKFYLCPAFYYDEKMGISNRMNHVTKEATRSVGDLENSLQIPNPQLLKLDHAPLCRTCDAFHCNRCIWLNQKLTWDNNTPSHQQCVISHLERNAARELSLKLQEAGFALDEIKKIDYLDPFDVKEDW